MKGLIKECGACNGCEETCKLDAESPPALGGEPETLMVRFEDHKVGQAALLEHIESLKTQLQESTAHLAPLKAENSRLRQHKIDYMDAAEETSRALNAEIAKKLHAMEELRKAFVIVAGETSPFAKEALRRFDEAIKS